MNGEVIVADSVDVTGTVTDDEPLTINGEPVTK